jgi:hypothetical protein
MAKGSTRGFDRQKERNCMSEIYEPPLESSKKRISAFGVRAKERLLTQVRQEPVKTFSIILAGSILLSVLVGYGISRMEEESKRQRFVEDWMREVTKWIGRHGRNIGDPIRGSLEATKSAVEEFSNSSARVGRHLHPFLEKQKHAFLNLF